MGSLRFQSQTRVFSIYIIFDKNEFQVSTNSFLSLLNRDALRRRDSEGGISFLCQGAVVVVGLSVGEGCSTCLGCTQDAVLRLDEPESFNFRRRER